MDSQIDIQEERMNKFVEHTEKILNQYPEIRHWEVFGGTQLGQDFQIEKSYMKQSNLHQTNIITMRIFGVNGKTGSVSLNKFSKDFVRTGVENAVHIMKASIENTEFKKLAKPSTTYPAIKTPWDPEIASLTADDALEIIDDFLQQKDRDERITSVSGGLSYSDSRIRLLNSNGIDQSERATDCQAGIEFVMAETIKGKKEDTRGYDYQGYNFFSDLSKDIQNIFNNAYSIAVKGLHKTKIETKNYPVILDPSAVSLLISSPICSGVNAESVYQKRSFLQDAVGKKIAPDVLTIIDNPLLEGGLESTSFDAEGIRTQTKEIVKDGVLKTLLHNTYTANLFGTTSTGNATRGWGSPSIGISTFNIDVKPGETSKDEMIEDISEGIYIKASYDRPNIVTGEFSGLIAVGFLIEDGELTTSLRESMIGTSLLELYGKIVKISREQVRKTRRYLPYVLLEDLKISGSK